MASSKFKRSGSMPTWPSICISKKRPLPTKRIFPPEAVIIIATLNYQTMDSVTANWTGSFTIQIETPGAPAWHGYLLDGQVQLEAFYRCDFNGKLIELDLNGTLPNIFAPASWQGLKPDSVSLTPYNSGPIPLDGTYPGEASLASVVG